MNRLFSSRSKKLDYWFRMLTGNLVLSEAFEAMLCVVDESSQMEIHIHN